MTTHIYRFLSFESFVDLVQRKELAFVTYDLWQDPYEGFVIRALQTDEGRTAVLDWLKANNNGSLPPDVKAHNLQIFCKTVHLQSWTKSPESDALWRIYSHSNNAVRIKTTIKKQQQIGGVTGFQVEYKEMSLEQELKRIFVHNSMHIQEAFSCKREAFSHENEYRLMSDVDLSFLPEQNPKSFNPFNQKETWLELYEKGVISREDRDRGLTNIGSSIKPMIRNVKHISYSHIPDFIESVMVHPRAEDWFVETVKRYCETNQIMFEGKSGLYTFDHR